MILGQSQFLQRKSTLISSIHSIDLKNYIELQSNIIVPPEDHRDQDVPSIQSPSPITAPFLATTYLFALRLVISSSGSEITYQAHPLDLPVPTRRPIGHHVAKPKSQSVDALIRNPLTSSVSPITPARCL